MSVLNSIVINPKMVPQDPGSTLRCGQDDNLDIVVFPHCLS